MLCINFDQNVLGYILGDFILKLIWSPWTGWTAFSVSDGQTPFLDILDRELGGVEESSSQMPIVQQLRQVQACLHIYTCLRYSKLVS
jgi:hypothetical protein